MDLKFMANFDRGIAIRSGLSAFSTNLVENKAKMTNNNVGL